MQLADYLKSSYTAYHAVANAEVLLRENGFEKLSEQEPWRIEKKGKYYVTRGGSAIIAFQTNVKDTFYAKIIASHTDSPCLKLKENPEMENGAYKKLNVETYGGGIWYSFFDRPLRVAGQIVVKEGNALKAKNVVSNCSLVIPSLAVHMNRGVNEGFAVNPQIDLLPLAGFADRESFLKAVSNEEVLAYDLFVVPDQPPFVSGLHDEFLSAPRIDNLSSVLASLLALTKAQGDGVTIACAFDNEEVGSSTLSGAGSDFLRKTVERIGESLGFSKEEILSCGMKSFAISLDNAHAMHPNHAEKCDITNRPVMGGGVVIKGHANKAYCTDARSSALVKEIFLRNGTPYQSFYNRSDMKSGSTLGAISLKQFGVLTVDLGLAQLAMHAAVETVALKDFESLVNGLVAFYDASLQISGDEIRIL